MSDLEATAGALEKLAFFADLSPDAVRAVSYVMRRQSVDDGHVLFREGDVGDGAYVVLEGAIEIIYESQDGALAVRSVLGKGELFGELALFGSGARAAGARARGRTVVGFLGYQPFVEIIRTWPDVATALLRLQTRRFLELEKAARDQTEQ